MLFIGKNTEDIYDVILLVLIYSSNKDVDYLRQQAKENITRNMDERLPEGW
jgi:hypothetical protein